MTNKQLQQFLDEEKWKDSEAHACDMCGRYARCRYCVRTEQYPCAMAHGRLLEAMNAPVPDPVPDWLLPEPDVAAKFGTPVADEADEGAEADEASAPQPAPVQEERPHVIRRGEKGEVRLCALRRRASAAAAPAAEEDAPASSL